MTEVKKKYQKRTDISLEDPKRLETYTRFLLKNMSYDITSECFCAQEEVLKLIATEHQISEICSKICGEKKYLPLSSYLYYATKESTSY